MLRGANPLLRSSALRIGQRIIVPMSGRVVPASAWSVPPEPRYRRVRGGGSAAGRHRVTSGETASSIARQYGVGLTALLNANGMTMGSVIRPGEWLRIPK
jgi:LysM repeat protein